MINISEDDAKLFEQNGYSKEHVGATVTHYRQQGLSDDEIQKKINTKLSGWKSNQPISQPIQKQVAQKPVATIQKPKPVQNIQQNTQPLTGGVAKNYVQNWDNKGRVYYTDANGNEVKPENSINPLEKFGRKIQAKATNVDALINRPSDEQRKQKEEQAKFLALLGGTIALPNPFNPTITAVAKNVAKPLTNVVGNIGNKAVRNLAKGTINNAIRTSAGATRGAIDSVPWSFGEAALEKVLGYNSEETLPQKIAHNAKDFAMFTGASVPIVQTAKYISKTPLAKSIVEGARNQLDMHPAIADAAVGVKNFFVPEAKFQNKNDTLAKLEKLNEVKNKKHDFTNKQLSQIENAKEMSIDDFGKMHKELIEGGDALESIKRELIEENSTASKLQADMQFNNELDKLAYEFKQKPFNQLTEQEQNEFYIFIENKFNKNPQAPESNLSHVEEQVDTTLPKEEPTAVKNDSRMTNDVQQETTIPEGWYQDEFGNIVKNPPKAKIQRFNKDELAKKQKEEKIGITPKNKLKEEINTEQKFEFIPEDTTEPMTGSVPQPEIKPEINKPKNMFSQREKNEIRKKAEQHRKETNNFKFPEEDPGDRIHNEVTEYIKQADKEQAERIAKEQQEVTARRQRYEKLKKEDYNQKEKNKINEFNNNVVDLSDRFGKNTHKLKRKPGRPKKNEGIVNDDKNIFRKELNKKEGVETLEYGEAEGADTSWNTHAVQDKKNYGEDYDLGNSQKQYKNNYKNGTEEVNSIETAKSSRFIKDDANFQKFYDRYSKASEEEKQVLLNNKLKKIKQTKNAKAAQEFYEDIMNQVERDKLRYENGLSDVEVSDLNEAKNVAKAFKENKVDVNTMYDEELGKQGNKRTSVKNKVFDLINDAIEKEDAPKLQSLLQNHKNFLNKQDTNTIKLKDKAYSKAAELSRKEMQSYLDKGDFEGFHKAAKRTESIRKNDKTLHSLKESKQWSNKEEQIFDEKGNLIAQGQARGKVGTGQTFDSELGLHRDLGSLKDKYTAWEQEKKYWEQKVKEAKNIKDIHNFFNKNGNIKNTTTIKLSDLAKHDKIYEQFKDLDDLEVIVRTASDDIPKYANGGYNEGKNIIIDANKEHPLNTLFHEVQHHVDYMIRRNAPKGSRLHAVEQSRIKRTNEYTKFIEDTPSLQEIKNEVVKLQNEGLSCEKIREIIGDENADLINKAIDLDQRYRNGYLERRANKAGKDLKLDKKGLNNGQVREVSGISKERWTEFQRNSGQSGIVSKVDRRQKVSEKLDENSKETPSNEQQNKPRLGIRKTDKGIQSAHYTPDGTYYSIDELNKAKPLFKTEKQKQLFKDLVKYSTEDEKTLIDLGILTKKQAEARLKKQHYKGEGVYIPTTYKPSKAKIDLEKDYNAGRKSKKGVFGEKKKYGVDREVDAKTTTENTIKRHIDIEHVKNVSKVVEDNFAEPIVNGEIKKGYIGVNKNILNTMMYGKYSKDWYKTLTGGMDDIGKAFKDKEVREGWLDLFARSCDKKLNVKYDYQIPESVFNKLVDGTGEKAAEWWSRYANNVKFGKIKGVGHWVGAINDALLNNFKKRVLTSSSFFVNNRIGNQIMIAMNSENPIEYLKSFKGTFKYRNKDVPTEIIQNSLLEAAKDATIRHRYTGNNAIDNALNLFNGSLIETKNLKGMKKVGAGLANTVIGLPNKGFNKLSEKLMKFNQLAEDAERRQIFSQIVEKSKRDLIKKTGQNMIKEEEILKHINSDSEIHALVVKEIEDTLGDYKNFSPLEQKTLKRIVPFYSWYRTITRHTVKLMKEHPERAGLLALELKHLNELGEDNGIKEYQRYGIPLKLKEDRTGKNLVMNKGHAVPYMTFKELLDEGGKGSVSPLIKVPLEATRGKKFFLDQEISNGRYIRTGYKWNKKDRKYDEAYYDTKKQDWVRDKEDKVKLDKNYKYGALPISTRLGYVGKELLTDTVAPYLNNSLINGEKILTTANKFRKTGKFKIPDRIYDASFGGYNHEDLVGFDTRKNKPITRYVGNRLSPKHQAINALFGLSLQNKAEMNQKELKKLEEKREEVKAKKAKFQKKKTRR